MQTANLSGQLGLVRLCRQGVSLLVPEMSRKLSHQRPGLGTHRESVGVLDPHMHGGEGCHSIWLQARAWPLSWGAAC